MIKSFVKILELLGDRLEVCVSVFLFLFFLVFVTLVTTPAVKHMQICQVCLVIPHNTCVQVALIMRKVQNSQIANNNL